MAAPLDRPRRPWSHEPWWPSAPGGGGSAPANPDLPIPIQPRQTPLGLLRHFLHRRPNHGTPHAVSDTVPRAGRFRGFGAE